MLARFFIDRPVLAWVISIVILILGGVAYITLPVSQYPAITPPSVQVTASYPGANAEVVADTVQFLGSRGDNEGGGGFKASTELKPDPVFATPGASDDDIPF